MIVDIIIAILLIFGFVIGFKRGFTRQLVSTVGMVLVLILSYILKNPVSVFMYQHFPFFAFKGLSALNILIYEVTAFVIIFSILMIVLRLLMMLTRVFEKILNATILLGIPSKILGGILGLVENYIIIFIALYFFSLPIFGFDLADSKVANIMLDKTPVMSNVCNNTLTVIDEVQNLKEQFNDLEDMNQLNQETIDLFVKYNIISQQSINDLIKKGKI